MERLHRASVVLGVVTVVVTLMTVAAESNSATTSLASRPLAVGRSWMKRSQPQVHEQARPVPPVPAALPPPRPEPARPPGPALPFDSAQEAAQVTQAVQAVAPGSTLGLEVFDRGTGNPVVTVAPDRQFYSASVVKLLIAVDRLVGAGGALPADQQRQVHDMLANSDDDIADTLWEQGGGPAIVTRMAGLLGLPGTVPPDDPSQWGNTLITAQDVVTIYRYITDRLPEPGRGLVLSGLSDVNPQAADGFGQDFGIPDGIPGVPRAVKQGWMSGVSEDILHTTGLVGPDARYVVVLLTSQSTDGSWSTATQAVTGGVAVLAPLIRDSATGQGGPGH